MSDLIAQIRMAQREAGERAVIADLEARGLIAPTESKQADEFYLQDSRSYVGNDVLWWAKAGNGYTTDLSKAQVFTKAEAQQHHDARRSDIPWPKAYIDGKVRPAVDMQYIKRDEALAGTGIVLTLEPKPKRAQPHCHACGSYMSEAQLWAGSCPKCDSDNRP